MRESLLWGAASLSVRQGSPCLQSWSGAGAGCVAWRAKGRTGGRLCVFERRAVRRACRRWAPQTCPWPGWSRDRGQRDQRLSPAWNAQLAHLRRGFEESDDRSLPSHGYRAPWGESQQQILGAGPHRRAGGSSTTSMVPDACRSLGAGPHRRAEGSSTTSVVPDAWPNCAALPAPARSRSSTSTSSKSVRGMYDADEGLEYITFPYQ